MYDIDDLEGIVATNLKERRAVAEEVELLIEAEIVEFKQWLNTLGVVPVISALREKALSIQADTMQSIERKLPNLTNREMKLLNKHTKSIINQMLKDPILKAKEIAGEPNAEEKLLLFKEIFDLQVEDEEQKAEPMQVEQGAFQLFKTNMAQGLATVASE